MVVAGQRGRHHGVVAHGLRQRGLVVGLAEQCGKGGRRELAADGERGLIGSEHGEALQLAHEVALRLVHVAQGPAGRQAIDLLDEGEVVLDGRARGERCGRGLAGESLGIEHLDALIEELRRVRSLLGENSCRSVRPSSTRLHAHPGRAHSRWSIAPRAPRL